MLVAWRPRAPHAPLVVTQAKAGDFHLKEDEKKRWRDCFTTWLVVYVLPAYPERGGQGDPADQVWLPYLQRWIYSGGIRLIFEDSVTADKGKNREVVPAAEK